MATKRNPRAQGDQGEMSAIVWLGSLGWPVFLPIGHSPDYDLVTDFGEGPARVQVKTSSVLVKDRWYVAVCTRGGNRSWTGVVKCLDPSRYDYLLVLVGGGRRWFIPAQAGAGRSQIGVGGPKYPEHESEAAEPLRTAGPSLDSALPWRDS